MNTFLASEAVSAADHVHDIQTLDRGCYCLHRLKAASRLDHSLERAKICLDDVLQVLRHSMLCVRRKLTAAFEAPDW